MSDPYYAQIALDWIPQRQSDKRFKQILFIVVLIMMVTGYIISTIKLPAEKRLARQPIPERIANFILEKKKPSPKIKKPESKPVIEKKKKKKLELKPKVKKKKSEKTQQNPLTKTQRKARVKAADSGLLALSNELADLMDTDSISAMVGGKVKAGFTASSQTGSQDKVDFLADASKGSGGVYAEKYATSVGKTELAKRKVSLVKQSLIVQQDEQDRTLGKSATNGKVDDSIANPKKRSTGIRAEEDITIVFDQHKGKLYSIYNRARRKNPGLKGKIILEIIIAPSGKVSKIKIVSSELDDKKLESRLLIRIKQINFGASNVEPMTVTYPIEFLPS